MKTTWVPDGLVRHFFCFVVCCFARYPTLAPVRAGEHKPMPRFERIVIDCIDEEAKSFYARWDFREVPGRPLRLFLSACMAR